MKSVLKILIGLAVLVAVVVGGILVINLTKEKPEPSTGKEDTYIVSVNADEITGFTLMNGQTELSYVHRSGAWIYTGDEAFPVNSTLIESMIADLEEVASLREITQEEMAPELFGLDKPSLRVSLSSAESTVSLIFGIYNQTYDGYYVQVVGETGAHIIEAAIYDALCVNLYDTVLADQYPAMTSTDAKLITLQTQDITREYVYSEEGAPSDYTGAYRWFIRPVADGEQMPVRTSSMTILASDITGITHTGCINYAPSDAERETYGLNTPSLTCNLTMEKETEVYDEETQTYVPSVEKTVFTVFFGETDGNGQVYMTWAGTEMVYTVAQATVDKLLAYLDWESLRPNDVCNVPIETVSGIQIEFDGQTVELGLTLKIENDKTVSYFTKDGMLIDTTTGSNFYNGLTGLQIEATALPETFTDQVYMTVTFHRNTEDAYKEMTLTIYAHNANFYRATFADREDMLISLRDIENLGKLVTRIFNA